jgi:hypothetical protein
MNMNGGIFQGMGMRTIMAVISLVCAAAYAQDAAPQAPAQDSADELIKKLGSEEYQVREDAQKKLEGMGPEILPKLKEAREQATDVEVKSRLAEVIRKIETPKSDPAKPAGRAARNPEEQLDKAKKILEQINKVMEAKDKSADDKLKDLARLSRELDQVTRRDPVEDWQGFGQPGAQGGVVRRSIRIVRNGQEWKFEDNGDQPKPKEEPPVQKTESGKKEAPKEEKKEEPKPQDDELRQIEEQFAQMRELMKQMRFDFDRDLQRMIEQAMRDFEGPPAPKEKKD